MYSIHYLNTHYYCEVFYSIYCRASKESRENICSLFLAHVLSHTSCYISYYTFYVVLEAVPDMLEAVQF